jgi:transposase
MGKTVLLHLRPGDKRILEKSLRTERDAKMWQRYNGILLCVRKPRKEVAKELRMTYRNLQYIIASYKKKGIEGLKYRKPPGKTPKITEEKKEKIIKILDSNPYGWETKNIRDTIIKQAGVTYTNRHITRIAHKWGYAKVVPRPRNRRMSPSALYQFKKKQRRN